MKYRLQPMADGSYILQENTRFQSRDGRIVDMWSRVGYEKIETIKQAEQIIKNLERAPIYLTKEDI